MDKGDVAILLHCTRADLLQPDCGRLQPDFCTAITAKQVGVGSWGWEGCLGLGVGRLLGVGCRGGWMGGVDEWTRSGWGWVGYAWGGCGLQWLEVGEA